MVYDGDDEKSVIVVRSSVPALHLCSAACDAGFQAHDGGALAQARQARRRPGDMGILTMLLIRIIQCIVRGVTQLIEGLSCP